MKISQTNFFVILLSFTILYTLSADVPNQGFNEFDLQHGITELNYETPLNAIDEDGKFYYIFFSFSEENITLSIKDNLNLGSTILTKDEWGFIPLTEIKNISDSVTFEIYNPYSIQAKLLFIDSSKEINLGLDKFLSWSYEIKNLNHPPSPLIFATNSISQKATMQFKNNYDYEILDDQNLIYYCIKEGSNCQYKKLSVLNLENKLSVNYKFKLNSFKTDENYYSFYMANINKINLRDLDYGIDVYLFLENDINDNYYIIKAKDINTIVIKFDIPKYGYKFITEDERQNINEYLNDIKFKETEYNLDEYSICNNENNDDYLIIKIKCNDTESEGSINIFNNIASIKQPISINIQSDTYTLISISNDDENYRYKLISDYFLLFYSKSWEPLGIFTSKIIEPRDSLYAVANNEEDIKIEVEILGEEEEEEKEEEKEEEGKEEEIIEDYEWKIDIINQENLTNFFNESDDSYFIRAFSHSCDFGFYFSYFSNIEEKYYLFNKIYFGGGEINQNITNVESYVKNEDFNELIHLYGTDYFKLINNEEITITGSKLLTYYNSYGTLYDLFLQKENDFEVIDINNNYVKLFIGEKDYTLNLKTEYYIKLDSKYLETEVVFTYNETDYTLNKDKRVIKDLFGDNIKVKSKQNALVYFYKKLKKGTNIEVIEFDKEKSGQNLKFNITLSNNNGQIMIVKDFGFKECYPMIKKAETIKILENKATIYIENLYDKIKNEDLYEKEGEQYLIYLYDSFDEENLPTFNSNITIEDLVYSPNLLTKGNKYNFEVIPAKSSGSIILSANNKRKASYRFFPCDNKQIQFYIKNTNGDIYEQSINSVSNLDYDLKKGDNILEHSFYSESEFGFIYSFLNPKIEPLCEKRDPNKDFIIMESPKNIIHVIFQQNYINCLNQYYIIIAKKDKTNSRGFLDDICKIGKLMTQNSNSIMVKTIFENSEKQFIMASVDISKLNIQQDTTIMVNVINYNVLTFNDLSFDKPQEFNVSNSEEIEFNLEQKVEFDFGKRSQFKFNYTQDENTPLIVYFIFESVYTYNFMVVKDDNIKDYSINYKDNIINLNLTKSGVYYFKFHTKNNEHDGGEQVNYFTTYIPNKVIYTCNLTEKVYYNNDQLFSKKDLGPRLIKVHNLEEEDKYALLSYRVLRVDNDDDEKYDYNNPFEICEENDVKCKKVEFFTFKSKTNYTIKIHFAKNRGDNNRYCNPTFTISQIYSDSIVENGKTGLYNISDIKLFNFDLGNKNSLYLSVLNDKATYISDENEKIELSNLEKLSWKPKKINSKIELIENNNKFGIIAIVPENNNIETKAIIADKSITQKKEMKIDISTVIYFTILL